MRILTRLAEKSWETPGADTYRNPEDYRPASSTVGLYVYMGVVVVLFSLMTAAYIMRMGIPGVMDHSADDWRALPEPPLLWVNTAILVASSAAWEQARRASIRGAASSMRTMAFAGGLVGLLFLVGQVMLWRQYQGEGYFLASNPANAFFYLLTAVHGLHLAGGLVAFARTTSAMVKTGDEARIGLNVRLCAIYWHFLLLVWIFLVGLLVMT